MDKRKVKWAVEAQILNHVLSDRKKSDSGETVMTSRQIAEILERPHSAVVRQIAQYLCAEKGDCMERGFRPSSFRCSGKNYPMYELTENACMEYKKYLVQCARNTKNAKEKIKRFDRLMKEYFRKEEPLAAYPSWLYNDCILICGSDKNEYKRYKDLYNLFVDGPGVYNREIKDFTDAIGEYEEKVFDRETGMSTKQMNDLYEAAFKMALAAELQGFIYGYRIAEAFEKTKRRTRTNPRPRTNDAPKAA